PNSATIQPLKSGCPARAGHLIVVTAFERKENQGARLLGFLGGCMINWVPGFLGSLGGGMMRTMFRLLVLFFGIESILISVSLAESTRTAPIAETEACAEFPCDFIPFSCIYYISGANPAGDRLIVGRLDEDPAIAEEKFQFIGQLPLPNTLDQQYCG